MPCREEIPAPTPPFGSPHFDARSPASEVSELDVATEDDDIEKETNKATAAMCQANKRGKQKMDDFVDYGNRQPHELKPFPGHSEFSRLALFHTIFVIDDTRSMQVAAKSNEPASSDWKTRWNVLTQSMWNIGNIAAEYDPDGVDIHFLISTHLNNTNIRSGQEVLNLLAQVDVE